ncbi:winged helix-turn-helix domain-containing protein [Paraburkholderia sp. C35]|uniref:ATP-binding protein n=1 Tax=Paraburkholderia sp. C35 TaxID=2126993 RepID=UPI001EF6EEC5|nr:winged helix-turn-helix domain-containing protein [Paraburkholderia sp. C35]
MDTPAKPPNESVARNAVIPLGQFELDLGVRALCKDGHEVPLGSRAFDILTVIVLAGGRIVTKDELMETVWPGLFVEESNIHVHLSAVRKALGDHRQLIDTVPGRGYRFMTRESDVSAARTGAQGAERTLVADTTDAGSTKHPLPRRRPLFGREAALEEIDNRFALTRVVTLTGPGGVGKTCLAVELAHRKAAEAAFEVAFIDLSPFDSASDIARALDDTIAMPGGEAMWQRAQTAPQTSRVRTLVVLDNAEHLIDDVARIVEGLMARHDSLYVLVTSRERLRIATETVFRVEPLGLPPAGESRERLVQSPAVKLFLERASLAGARIDDDSELRLVAEICRRLDGLPLAIELAVGRASVFGLEGVRQRLEERFLFLADGYRTAQPRHRTLRAAFDWSFTRLSPCEQAVYLRVARFSRYFTIDAVFAVACDDEIDRASVLDCVAQLVEKSLLDVSFDGVMAKYRLSESARAYALKQLERDGESPDVARRHAQYVCAALAKASCDNALADARVAFEWAFSPAGDEALGIELAVVLVPMLAQRGFMEECARYAAVAIAALEAMPYSAHNLGYLDALKSAKA